METKTNNLTHVTNVENACEDILKIFRKTRVAKNQNLTPSFFEQEKVNIHKICSDNDVTVDNVKMVILGLETIKSNFCY